MILMKLTSDKHKILYIDELSWIKRASHAEIKLTKRVYNLKIIPPWHDTFAFQIFIFWKFNLYKTRCLKVHVKKIYCAIKTPLKMLDISTTWYYSSFETDLSALKLHNHKPPKN
jgi:hypothetical protein